VLAAKNITKIKTNSFCFVLNVSIYVPYRSISLDDKVVDVADSKILGRPMHGGVAYTDDDAYDGEHGRVHESPDTHGGVATSDIISIIGLAQQLPSVNEGGGGGGGSTIIFRVSEIF
jgi:hypothetical protein